MHTILPAHSGWYNERDPISSKRVTGSNVVEVTTFEAYTNKRCSRISSSKDILIVDGITSNNTNKPKNNKKDKTPRTSLILNNITSFSEKTKKS